MKSERRHALQRNQLANWLDRNMDTIKPYASWVIGGVIVGVLIALIISFQRGESASARAANWDTLQMARNTTDTGLLKELAAQTAGSEVGQVAALTLADISLAQGAQQSATDRAEARKKFEEAVANYTSVAEAADDPMFKNRGYFGLGKAFEWLRQFDDAKAAYEKVEGPLALQARERLTELQRPSTLEFYEMYAAHKPKPPVDPLQIPPNFEFSEDGAPGDFDLLEPLLPRDEGGEIDFERMLDDPAGTGESGTGGPGDAGTGGTDAVEPADDEPNAEEPNAEADTEPATEDDAEAEPLPVEDEDVTPPAEEDAAPAVEDAAAPAAGDDAPPAAEDTEPADEPQS